MFLLLKRVLDAAYAPEAIEAENQDIDEDAAKAGDCVKNHVASASVAADDCELVNLVECAVDGRENDWINDLSVSWEANWVEALDKAGAAIAECAKEEEVGELACDFIREAKECGKASRLGIGHGAVVIGKRPNQ